MSGKKAFILGLSSSSSISSRNKLDLKNTGNKKREQVEESSLDVNCHP